MHALRLPLLLVALGCLGGCVMKHSLTIDTEPQGATIWVNDEKQPGLTPVTIPFTYYGGFDVRVEKEGYQSVATRLNVATELDGYPVVDLPLEILGGHKRFRRVVALTALPEGLDPESAKAIVGGARAFRAETHRAIKEPNTPGRQAPEILR